MAEIFLSNYLEVLYDQLKKNLFASGSFFTGRMVIVPSITMKNWLHLRLAEDPQIKVSAGIHFCLLHQAFTHILSENPATNAYYFPNAFELALSIESHLRSIVLLEENCPTWEKIVHYLKKDESIREKRLISLSKQLATLFYKYGIYGRELLEAWQQDLSKAQWQIELWKRIFNQQTQWVDGFQSTKQFLSNMQIIKKERQIHVFSLSSLPPLFFHFFEKIANYCPLYFYQLSPCMAFWSDLFSDKEQARIRSLNHLNQHKKPPSSSFLKWEDYIEDRHRLLANWGKVGRQFALMIEESTFLMHSHYLASSESLSYYEDSMHEDIEYISTSKWSRLQALQTDLLFLRNPEKEKHLPFSDEDDSIQIHGHYTRLREIQSLYQLLLSTLSQKTEIKPEDILIMAPNILDYEEAIREIFGGPESLIDYQISDSLLGLKNSFLEGFFELFELPEKKWDSQALLKLIKNPFFCKKAGFTAEQVSWLEKWIDIANIRWGLNGHHREAILKSNYKKSHLDASQLNHTSWEDGFNRLVEKAIEINDDPLEITQLEFLGSFRTFLFDMHADLEWANEDKTLQDWGEYFSAILLAYFEESEENEKIKNFIKNLKDLPGCLQKAKFPFCSIFQKLKDELLSESHAIHPNHLSSVRFCSLLPARAIPAKIICLIGMNEQDFPRRNQIASLDALQQGIKSDYCPSKSDLDRYLLIEAILSARSKLIVSYLAHSPVDSAPLLSSVLIQEFIDYLDECYSSQTPFSKSQVIKHPLLASDPEYFFRKPGLFNFNANDYKIALHLAGKTPSIPSQEFSLVSSNETSSSLYLELTFKDLIDAMCNPLKHFLQKNLGIYLKKEIQSLDFDEFILPKWQKNQFLKESFNLGLESTLDKSHRFGKLSAGLFAQSAELSLRQEFSELAQYLASSKILLSDMKSFLFENQFHIGEKTVSLKGKIPNIFPQGFLIFGEDRLSNLAKNFPYILWLANQNEIDKRILFTKSKNAFNLPQIGATWQKCIEYYEQTISRPYFLIPEWIESILKKDKEKLSKDIDQTLSGDFFKTYHPHLHWYFSHFNIPTADQIIESSFPWVFVFFEQINALGCDDF